MKRSLLLVDLDNIVTDGVFGKGRFRERIGGLKKSRHSRELCAVVVAANTKTLELLAEVERITGDELPDFILKMALAVGRTPDQPPEFAFWPTHPQAADTLLVRALAGTPVLPHSNKFLPYDDVLFLSRDQDLKRVLSDALPSQRDPEPKKITWEVPGLKAPIQAGWRYRLNQEHHRPFLHPGGGEHPANERAIPPALANAGSLADAATALHDPDNWTLVSGSGGVTLPSIARMWCGATRWGEARLVDEDHDGTRWGPARPARISGLETDETLPLTVRATSADGPALVRSSIPPSLLATDPGSALVVDGWIADKQWLLDHEQHEATEVIDVHFNGVKGRADVAHGAHELPRAWWVYPVRRCGLGTSSRRENVPFSLDATVGAVPYVFDGQVVLAAPPDEGEITLSQRLPKGMLHLEQGRIIYSRRGANAGDEIEVRRAQELTLASTEHYLWGLPVWVHVPATER